MKTKYTVAFSMLAGAALGAAAIQGLHAQATPPVYYVAEIDVTNPDAYAKEYAPKAQAIIKAMGGRQLAIGGAGGAGAKPVTALDGEAPKRVVVQVWDNMDKMKAWRANPEYVELRKERRREVCKIPILRNRGRAPIIGRFNRTSRPLGQPGGLSNWEGRRSAVINGVLPTSFRSVARCFSLSSSAC